MPSDLTAPAKAAVDCLGVGPTDSVLVVCNEEQRLIAASLIAAAKPRARTVTVLEFATLSRHGEEPPAEVAEAMARADVVFAPTSYSLSQTQARIEATRRGTRIATLPTITQEIFARTLPVDYAELKRTGEWLAARLTAASTGRISSAAGTEIVFRLEGRTDRSDDCNLQQPGMFGNLPAGEAYIAPLETLGDGMIVFDGSLPGQDCSLRRFASPSKTAAPSTRTATSGSGCSRQSTQAASTVARSPSSGSARIRPRSSPATCSRTRR
jgi:aminopeptidase